MLFGTNKKNKSVQDILGFDQISEDMIVINKNEFRMVLECSRVNMKSLDEKELEETIDVFKETINQIRYPVQWLRVTKVLDMHRYIKDLERQAEEAKEDVRKEFLMIIRNHIEREIEVKRLTTSEIYLVIGYRIGQQQTEISRSFADTIRAISKSLFSRNYFLSMSDNERVEEVSKIFNDIQESLTSSLKKIGSRVRRLRDEELYQLLYQSYRRDMANVQRWGKYPANGIPMKVRDLDAEIVQDAN